MIWFIQGALSIILGIFYHKKKGDFGNKAVINGEIIGISQNEHSVSVRYSYPDSSNTFVAVCKDIGADLKKLNTGTMVLVVIDKNNPSCPKVVKYNTKGKNMTVELSERAAYITGIMFFIAGIISLIK